MSCEQLGLIIAKKCIQPGTRGELAANCVQLALDRKALAILLQSAKANMSHCHDFTQYQQLETKSADK